MDQYLILFFGYYSFVIFLMESGKFDKNMIGSGYLQHGTLLVYSMMVVGTDYCDTDILFGSHQHQH